MNIDIILFHFFSISALLASLMVITLSNAVHSVLFLILVFFNISGLLLVLGAEFLSFMFLIVYVGAIAVLFLFVVMMLNIKLNLIRIDIISIFPLITLFFSFLIYQFFEMINSNFIIFEYNKISWIAWFIENNSLKNIEVIGNVLYTKFSLIFLLCGLILLVAMIGSIVLTMHQRVDTKKQKIEIQLSRNSDKIIKFINLRI